MSVTTKQAMKIANNMWMLVCEGRGSDTICYPIGYLEDGKREAEEEMNALMRHYETYILNPRLTTLIQVMETADKVDIIVLWNDSQHRRYWGQ